MDHVVALAQLAGRWPPLLVRADDRRVIDGNHRLAAARRLGLTVVECELFRGSDFEGYIESVRRNVEHGLPLSLRERRAAAGRILERCHEWSDRRIAGMCGVSAATVSKIRREVPGIRCPTAQSDHLDMRTGRDGRQRPIVTPATREELVEAVRAHPNAPLRAIAALVGRSPETVRRVRLAVSENSEGVAACGGSNAYAHLPVSSCAWQTDAALISRDGGSRFIAWFQSTTVERHDLAMTMVVPKSRLYEVADECRRRAAFWTDFAKTLERRSLPVRSD
jgi:hypothetical protein